MNPNSQINKKKIRRVDVLTTTEFSGPLPHPVILERYEIILPGMADRILTMAEHQAKHRREVESRVVRSNIRSELLGVIVTFLITMASISGSIYLIATDKQVAGFLTMISTLVYNFYSGNRSEKETVKKMNEAETSDDASGK